MKPAQFEEKEYEGALYTQLSTSGLQWSPGQVLEHYLGFDRGLFMAREFLWNLHGYHGPLAGISVFDDLWPVLPRRSLRNRLPTFRLNCFVQAKRPYVGRRRSRKLRSLGIGQPFFKFVTEPEQQVCLDAVANRLSDRALFVYAAPVFGASGELFAHMTANDVAENSTFPSTAALSGHGAWYYSEPGAVGVRNPDFSRMELPSLPDRILGLIDQSRIQRAESQTQSEFLRSLADQLRLAIREDSRVTSTPRAAYLSEEWARIEAFARRFEAPPAIASYLQVGAFARYFNLSWLVIDDTATNESGV
jgi:hypothetical protein